MSVLITRINGPGGRTSAVRVYVLRHCREAAGLGTVVQEMTYG